MLSGAPLLIEIGHSGRRRADVFLGQKAFLSMGFEDGAYAVKRVCSVGVRVAMPS